MPSTTLFNLTKGVCPIASKILLQTFFDGFVAIKN